MVGVDLGCLLFVFLHRQVLSGFHTAGAHLDTAACGKGCPLKVRIFPLLSCWIKFGGTNTIGVSSADDRSFIKDYTFLCHGD